MEDCMRSGGGQTTLVKRVLDRRAEKPPTSLEGTTAATIAVMARVLPPPKALLVCQNPQVRAQVERRITADLLDVEVVADEHAALRLFATEFRPVVLTDSLEMVRKLRARPDKRAPFIVYLSELDEGSEREAGLVAGADQCVGHRVSERELDARLACARRIAELETVLRITLAENRSLSATDDLTHVSSRRFFSKHFPREVARAARFRHPLTLILGDIDNFRKINESYGHPGGDEVLRQLGPRLLNVLRRGVDWVARIGGEEFAIVLPETAYQAGLEVARKLRREVANTPFQIEKKNVPVTVSFGLCGLESVPAGERQLAQRIMKIADAALYRSKQDGRNRVTATVLNPPGS
jgi:two-component system, cell cycle response regulator